MTNTSPITDIHAAEKAAKNKIEKAKEANAKKISQTRDDEAAKLVELEEKLRAAGKERLTEAKTKAAKAADEKLKKGKADDESMINVARGKLDDAVKEGVKAFTTHVGV
jgi:vacuolar-type H+-ATPase subunit H